LSSNASIRDIITNSVEAYRKQEQMTEAESLEEDESEESSSSSSLSSDEESLTQEIMSLEMGDIADIVKVLTEGVEYRTNDGVKVMNGDKIRKLFVKQLRKLLSDNDDFEKKFTKNFRSVSQKNQKLTTLSAGNEPLMETATEVLEKYVQAKQESKLDKTINLSGYGQTKIGNDLFQH